MENQTVNQNPNPPVLPISQTPTQTPPVSNPSNPPVLKQRSKLPILIIGMLLFLLIAGSAAGFYVLKQQSLKTEIKPTPSSIVQKPTPTPTIDPFANWQIYVNSTKGISFKYPPIYNIQTENSQYVVFSKTDEVSNQKILSFLTLNFIPTKNPKDLKYCEESRSEQQCLTSSPTEEDGPNNIKIRSFHTSRGYSKAIYWKDYIQFIDKPNIEFISINAGDDTKNTIKAIISTLKFTDNQTTDTSSWKTYESTNKEFSFKYPSDWRIEMNGPYVSLFPPEAMQDTPASNDSFELSNIPYLPLPTPNSYNFYMPFKPYIINGNIGRKADWDKTKGTIGRVVGCPFETLIQFPSTSGTLTIRECEDLSPRTEPILKTLIIKQ